MASVGEILSLNLKKKDKSIKIPEYRMINRKLVLYRACLQSVAMLKNNTKNSYTRISRAAQVYNNICH